MLGFSIMVRSERLELSHLAAPEPKSGASTNSATTASCFLVTKVIGITLTTFCNGRATWIRTREWRHQKPLPYRLAIALQVLVFQLSASQLRKVWCGRRDLNSHTLRRQNLNLVRLPIPPRPHRVFLVTKVIGITLTTFCNGRATWIRTREWRHQKPLPYRLAIALQVLVFQLSASQSRKVWCGRRDLNSHTLRRQNLNLVRLPIPPRPRFNTSDQ